MDYNFRVWTQTPIISQGLIPPTLLTCLLLSFISTLSFPVILSDSHCLFYGCIPANSASNQLISRTCALQTSQNGDRDTRFFPPTWLAVSRKKLWICNLVNGFPIPNAQMTLVAVVMSVSSKPNLFIIILRRYIFKSFVEENDMTTNLVYGALFSFEF